MICSIARWLLWRTGDLLHFGLISNLRQESWWKNEAKLNSLDHKRGQNEIDSFHIVLLYIFELVGIIYFLPRTYI